MRTYPELAVELEPLVPLRVERVLLVLSTSPAGRDLGHDLRVGEAAKVGLDEVARVFEVDRDRAEPPHPHLLLLLLRVGTVAAGGGSSRDRPPSTLPAYASELGAGALVVTSTRFLAAGTPLPVEPRSSARLR